MTNQETRKIIVAGPSREQLFDALRLRHEGRKISFTVEPMILQTNPQFKVKGEVFDAFIESIQVEDGSGNSWNLVLNMLGKRHRVYFNTLSRTGTLYVVPLLR